MLGWRTPLRRDSAGLGGARFAHHLAEHVTTSRHTEIIASDAIDLIAEAAGMAAWHQVTTVTCQVPGSR